MALGMLTWPVMQKRKHSNYTRREAGSIRGVGLLIIIVLAALFVGASKIQTALKNRIPAAMSYDTFVQTKPNAEWLLLTNCQLNLFQASYLHNIGDNDPHPNQYYIPVHGIASPTGKICILLKTSEPDLIATINEIRGLKTDSAVMNWTSKNTARAFPKRTVRA